MSLIGLYGVAEGVDIFYCREGGAFFSSVIYEVSLVFLSVSYSIIIFCFMILSLRTLQKSLNWSRV